MPALPPTLSVRIWDLPTRIFHALLASCVAGLLVTGEIGGALMELHFLLGYSVISLVLFRLIWGVCGGHWSRFVNFVPSPISLFSYLNHLKKREHVNHIGHNPLGAISVLALLFFCLIQAISGLMSDDEISYSGPWTNLVSGDWVSFATRYHGEIGKVLLIALICMHIAAVLYYKRVKKVDLITPMLNGNKLVDADTPSSKDTLFSRLIALCLWIACAYLVYRLVNLT